MHGTRLFASGVVLVSLFVLAHISALAADQEDAMTAAKGNSRPLSSAEIALLDTRQWTLHVGKSRAVWVDVRTQRLRLIENATVILEVPCSTARRGTGSEVNSNKTPLGWHVIAEKIGRHAPWGTVFSNTTQTKTIWKQGQTTPEDLILTRVLVLDGLDVGMNKGGNVDSRSRGIYIHGTNDEIHIGEPTSHGCVRLRNNDVISVFDQTSIGTLVLITDNC